MILCRQIWRIMVGLYILEWCDVDKKIDEIDFIATFLSILPFVIIYVKNKNLALSLMFFLSFYHD